MTTYRIALSFNIEAVHWTPGYPSDHPNSRPHGHSYIAEVVLAGDLKGGMIVAMEDLDSTLKDVKSWLDHNNLNEVYGLDYPTMECLAEWIFNKVKESYDEVSRVRVSRPTLDVWAEVERSL